MHTVWPVQAASEFAASGIDEINAREALEAFAVPAEAPFFIGMGIVNPRDLLRRREKVLVNEGVVVGKKNAESRMRVIPADDAGIRKIAVFDFVNVFPSILREGDVGAALRRVFARDAGFDGSEPFGFAAQ